MYRSYYHLAERPFEISTDTRFLWMGEKHKEALAMLKYGVLARKGFLLLTGDVGTGKTTLVNALLESLDRRMLVVNITDPVLEPMDLFNFIAASLNMGERFNNKADFLLGFSEFLRRADDEGNNVLLILDEAHRLTGDLLEQFRLLSNIELPQKKLINVFFVGQNEFNRTLMSPDCRALRQRITLTYNIKPLSEVETLAYIDHRLKVAGSEAKLFHPKAVKEVYRFSQGYPRLINIICDHALLTGFVKQIKIITPAVIEECSQELCLMGDTIRFCSSDFFGRSEREDPKPAPQAPAENPVGTAGAASASALKGIRITKQTDTRRSAAMAEGKRHEASSTGPPSPVMKQAPRKRRLWAVGALLALGAALLAVALQETSLFKVRPWGRIRSAFFVPGSARQGPGTVTRAPSAPLVASKSEARETPGQRTPLERAREELARGNLDRAAGVLEEAIKEHPPELHDLRALYAATLHRQAIKVLDEDPLKAEQWLTRAVSFDPHNAEAFRDLGKLYTASSKYAEAIRAYERAVALDGHSADTFFNLGFLYAETGDNARAERMFQRSAALHPPYLDKALYNLAAVQCKQDKRNQCIENLEAALAENPDNRRARSYLGRLKGHARGSR